MKNIFVLLLVLVPLMVLFGQETPVEEGATLTAGKNASLGVEATTAFAWDIENNSTGLETKAGLELLFPLFPVADRGLFPKSYDDPAVRVVLKDASFSWLNTYSTTGGNYEQDSFNSWTARPLVFTFDHFYADVVWTNYFFRIASSTTAMQTTKASLFSIFDDVMDAYDRWYIRRGSTRALWNAERYNIQQFPLLKEKIERDYIDEDYRSSISGILALGIEFDWFSIILKAASAENGVKNDDNAWLFGADIEFVFNDLKLDLTGFAGFNYEKTGVGKNPLNFGATLEYQIKLSDRYILTPKIGFDFASDTISEEQNWEQSTGVILNTRGYDYITSSRILDWDTVIPVGASFSVSITKAHENSDTNMNMMLSWFEPAGKDSMIPNFGGFLQLEGANLTETNNSTSAFAVLAQIEYMIAEKFTPYIRGGYMAEFQQNPSSNTLITGNYIIKTAVGCYLTPMHFFSIDIRYEMDTKLLETGSTETMKSLFSTVFTIKM